MKQTQYKLFRSGTCGLQRLLGNIVHKVRIVKTVPTQPRFPAKASSLHQTTMPGLTEDNPRGQCCQLKESLDTSHYKAGLWNPAWLVANLHLPFWRSRQPIKGAQLANTSEYGSGLAPTVACTLPYRRGLM